MATWTPSYPTQGSNVRVPRPYGAGYYGESLYGQWEGKYLIDAPCTPAWGEQAPCTPAWGAQAPCEPTWGAQAPCTPAWGAQAPCAPAWTPKKDC
jgi:hypothetical protein